MCVSLIFGLLPWVRTLRTVLNTFQSLHRLFYFDNCPDSLCLCCVWHEAWLYLLYSFYAASIKNRRGAFSPRSRVSRLWVASETRRGAPGGKYERCLEWPPSAPVVASLLESGAACSVESGCNWLITVFCACRTEHNNHNFGRREPQLSWEFVLFAESTRCSDGPLRHSKTTFTRHTKVSFMLCRTYFILPCFNNAIGKDEKKFGKCTSS